MNCFCYTCAGPQTLREAFFHDPAVFDIPEYVCPRCLDNTCQGADDHRNECAPQTSWIMRLDAMSATQLFAGLIGVVGLVGLLVTGLWFFAMMLPVATIMWLGASWNQEFRRT